MEKKEKTRLKKEQVKDIYYWKYLKTVSIFEACLVNRNKDTERNVGKILNQDENIIALEFLGRCRSRKYSYLGSEITN